MRAVNRVWEEVPLRLRWAALLLLTGGAVSALASGEAELNFGVYALWLVLPLLFGFFLLGFRRSGAVARVIVYGMALALLILSALHKERFFSSHTDLLFFLLPIALLAFLDIGRRRLSRKWLAWAFPVIAILAMLLFAKSVAGTAKLETRQQVWYAAAAIGSEQPLTGIGLTTFPSRYDAEVMRELGKAPLAWGVAAADDLFLQAWLATGILGLGGLILIASEAVRRKYGLVFLPVLCLLLIGVVEAFSLLSVYAFGLLLVIGLADARQKRQMTF